MLGFGFSESGQEHFSVFDDIWVVYVEALGVFNRLKSKLMQQEAYCLNSNRSWVTKI